MKIRPDEIEIESFVRFECPFCYNVQEHNAETIRVNVPIMYLWCSVCENGFYLEMVISKYNAQNLGLDSGHLRIVE